MPNAAAAQDKLITGSEFTFQPAAVDGEPYGHADRDDCECLIVDGNGRQCRQDDERAEAPAADSEEGGIQRTRTAAPPFASEACLAAHANRRPRAAGERLVLRGRAGRRGRSWRSRRD